MPPPADAAEPFPSGKRLPREEEVGTAGSVCRWGDAAVGAVLPCGGVELVTAGGVARWCPPTIPLGVACLVKDDREIFRGGRVLYVPLSEFRQRSVFFTHSSIPIQWEEPIEKLKRKSVIFIFSLSAPPPVPLLPFTHSPGPLFWFVLIS